MLPIAQGNALGKRRPRLIHSAFLRLRKNATRRKRVTHYALNATRGVAPHKAGCSYRARHFNQCNIAPPGRCPGLCATIWLTARHTCAASTMKCCTNVGFLAHEFHGFSCKRVQRASLLGLCRAQPKMSRNLHETYSIILMATWSVALISRIFAQVSAEPNLFGLCRAQPKISKQIR